MVVEDKVPHSIASLRRVPASVLIVLDTGGELKFAKNLQTTTAAAATLIKSLAGENQIAVMQYSDKPEIIGEWTNDKAALLKLLQDKAAFGRRSRFVPAMNLAATFLSKRSNENRHLVLITDGTDNNSDTTERDAALKNLIAANVTVHVLSYTWLETVGLDKNTNGRLQKGDKQIPNRLPEEAQIGLPPETQVLLKSPRFGGISLDAAWLKVRKERRDALKESQTQLNSLATDTGGELILPETLEDLPKKAADIATAINANYVVTYIPKRALLSAEPGETRAITVVSRRVGLIVEARRKFVVPAKN